MSTKIIVTARDNSKWGKAIPQLSCNPSECQYWLDYYRNERGLFAIAISERSFLPSAYEVQKADGEVF